MPTRATCTSISRSSGSRSSGSAFEAPQIRVAVLAGREQDPAMQLSHRPSRAPLLRLVAEVCARDPLLQVLERAEVFDDVAAGVVEEDLAVLVAPDRDQPFEIVAIFEEVVDRLADAAPRDDRDFGPRGLLAL